MANAPLPTSDVDICNLALSYLGDQPIASLGDNSDRARECNIIYGATRDAVFRAMPWRCLRSRAVLVPISQIVQNGPITTITYPVQAWPEMLNVFAYQLPTDPYCLKVLHTNTESTDDWWVETAYEGPGTGTGKILISTYGTTSGTALITPMMVLYTARILDVTVYDSLLVETVATRLAWNLCYTITGAAKNAGLLENAYKAKIDEASGVDGQEGAPEVLDESDLVNVRF